MPSGHMYSRPVPFPLMAISSALTFRIIQPNAGVRLQGYWGETIALEGSKSPWEALRAIKTLPSISATFEKANTCAKRTFLLGEIQ